MEKCITYDCTKNIVKLQTVIFVDVLHYKTLYINNIIVVITQVLGDRIVCFWVMMDLFIIRCLVLLIFWNNMMYL